MENKWIRGAIPALLLHCSIGTVYCWSLFAQDIADQMSVGKGTIEWAFSLAIFFLGMSAAFAGDIVERNIKLSSRISTVCFSLGLLLTGICIKNHFLVGIYLSYGCLMGIGLGIGYLSPVKTLMLWFKEQKGLATGIAVAGFGLAKVIASPIITFLRTDAGLEIDQVFYVLAAIYAVLMFIGSLLLKKPEGWVEPHEKSNFKSLSMFKEPVFIGIWIMFYINITCGLALISQEKAIMTAVGMSAGLIGTMASITAIFNAGGRLGYSAVADKCKDRNTIYKLLFVLSITSTIVTLVTGAITNSIVPIVIVLLCVINSTYGGGFSNLPTLLSDRFGMKNVSKIHGLALTAWAMAGLTGNQISSLIVSKTGSYNNVLWVTLGMYCLALLVSFIMIKKCNKEM